MKKALILLTAVLVLCASTTALAGGKIRHRGQIVGDDETKVTLRLTKKGGAIRKVSALEVEGLFTRCDSGDFRFTIRALDPTKVNRKGNFRERLDNPDGSVFRISGKVKSGGKVVVGNVKSTPFESGGMTCQVDKQRFRTERA